MGLLGSFVSGFGLLGALQIEGNKKAAKKATKAAEQARQENLALFKGIYDQSRADLAPYNQAGQLALARLQQRTGLTPISGGQRAPMQVPAVSQPMGAQGKAAGGFAGTSPLDPSFAPMMDPGFRRDPMASGPDGGPMVKTKDDFRYDGASMQPYSPQGPAAAPQSAAQPGGPDWQAYLAANPDVAQQAAIEGRDPTEYAQQHYQVFGQNEGRNLPMVGAQALDPNEPPPEYFEETYAERPADMDVPTYQRAPDMAAPGAFSWDPSQIVNDKGYQFALGETINAVNAGSAARGLLRSGDAAKALQDRASGLAHQYANDYFNRAMQTYGANMDAYRYGQDRQDRNFLDDRSYGTNLWNTRQNRADNIFADDRNFAANRFDQGTNNLFNLTNLGQNAAAGTASAGNVFATNVAQGNNNVAQAQANSALWQQGQKNNMFGSAMRLAGAYFGGGF